MQTQLYLTLLFVLLVIYLLFFLEAAHIYLEKKSISN